MRLLIRACLFGIMVILLALSSPVHAQEGTAEFGVLETVSVAPGEVIQVAVAVRNVQGLYAVDFTLEFDPAIVQVVDMDTSMDGTQAGLGDFLDPGLLLFNTADNDTGFYRFVMSQINPSEPKSGEGNVVVIEFRGVKDGISALEITNLDLASGESTEISAQVVNSTLEVVAGAPTNAATIPVLSSTNVILLADITPTATFTPTAAFSATPTPSSTLNTGSGQDSGTATTDAISGDSQTEDGAGSDNQVTSERESEQSSWLMKNWWLPLLLLAVAVATGWYYLVYKKKSNPKEEI